MPWDNGAGGQEGTPSPASVRSGGTSSPGGARLRGRGRRASCPSSMVPMVSVPAALATSDAQILRRRAGHGRPPCHSPCPTPPAATRRRVLARQGRWPFCARGHVGEEQRRPHLFWAAESRAVPAGCCPAGGPRKTGPGEPQWGLGAPAARRATSVLPTRVPRLQSGGDAT